MITSFDFPDIQSRAASTQIIALFDSAGSTSANIINMSYEESAGLLQPETSGAATTSRDERTYADVICGFSADGENYAGGCVEFPKSIKLQRTDQKLMTEYKRCQFIRLIKKMMRELSEFRLSKKFLREYEMNSVRNIHLLRRLQQIYLDNKELFDSLRGTKSGSVPDEKSKGKRRDTLAHSTKAPSYKGLLPHWRLLLPPGQRKWAEKGNNPRSLQKRRGEAVRCLRGAWRR